MNTAPIHIQIKPKESTTSTSPRTQPSPQTTPEISKASHLKLRKRRPASRSKSREMPPPQPSTMTTTKTTTTKRRQPSSNHDFIVRSAPKHYNHWTVDNLKDILRTKIESKSKRRCNRNTNALKFLGGSATDGISAHKLRRRALRMSLPLTREQATELFRSISGGSDAPMSVHTFLLGLFPADYEASLTSNLYKQQTLMGLSEIDRCNAIGIDWNKKKVIEVSTLRWPPSAILKKLQQSFIKRGGGVAAAFKRYQVIRANDPGRHKPTCLGKLEMREVVQTIYRIPAKNSECDLFFECMANGKPNIQFVKMFRGLEDGVITEDLCFAKANKGATVSDKIGNYGLNKKGKNQKKNKKNKKKDGGRGEEEEEEMFDDTASWISLASTRAPSVHKLGPLGSMPRPSTAGTRRSAAHNIDRPLTAGSMRSSRSGRSLRSIMTLAKSSALPSARSQTSQVSQVSRTSQMSQMSQASKTSESSEKKKRRSAKKTARKKDISPPLQSATSSVASESERRRSSERSIERSGGRSARSKSSSRGNGGGSVRPRPQSATSSLARSRSSSRGNGGGSVRPRPQSATLARSRSATGVMSMAIASAAHYRRLRNLALSVKPKQQTLLYAPRRSTSARRLY